MVMPDAAALARQPPRAISAASAIRRERREVPAAPWAGGVRLEIHLEIRLAGPCRFQLARPDMGWAAGGIRSAIRTVVAEQKCLAAMGTRTEPMASGARLEIQGMLTLAEMDRDFRLPSPAA